MVCFAVGTILSSFVDGLNRERKIIGNAMMKIIE